MNNYKNNLKLIPFCQEGLDEAYKIYKKELYDVIEKVFGWDDKFQSDRFQKSYKLEWFHWIENQDERIGYVCFFQTENENEIHISLLIITRELQGNGHGKDVMFIIEQNAKQQNLKVALSSFKENKRAVSFYQNLGYKIASQDEHFIDLVLE
ncbi:MAG: GNAT family N-acetyltransferase [Bacteriovorax sp.]|nr:GNAT family N-acetyltransferase [Bacteriovorax sp.]